MQVYYKTQTAYCFSANCATHGKSLDVIDFIMHKENISKHEAILKAKSMIQGEITKPAHTRESILARTFLYFRNGLQSSKTAKEYLSHRGLDKDMLEIGYNSGQFHHGKRKDESLIQKYLELGLLIDKNLTSSKGGKAYSIFAKNSLCFPLKDHQGNIISLYFRYADPVVSAQDLVRPVSATSQSVKSPAMPSSSPKHFYLKNRQGLYPCYPSADTKKIILCESIIDTASLLQLPEITAKYSLLALYGTNGMTEEHKTALKNLSSLEEIILFLDGDQAGKKATEKYSQELTNLLPNTKISSVDTPDDEDINSLLISHDDTAIFTHLLDARIPRARLALPDVSAQDIVHPASDHPSISDGRSDIDMPDISAMPDDISIVSAQDLVRPASDSSEVSIPSLQVDNPHSLLFTTPTAIYSIKGGLRTDLDSLKVTLVIENPGTTKKSRSKLDLYEDKQTEKVSREAGEKLHLRPDLIESDLSQLVDLLDEYRESQNPEDQQENKPVDIPSNTRSACMDFLSKPNLMQRINELIGKSGVVGEENNRLFLFGIASSYKMPETLHALIQGSSGSGKTHLLATIMDFMPEEDMISLTRVTESSLYNYGQNELKNKLIGIEDYDGLEEKAELAFRELQSKGMISSSTSGKNERTGEITGFVKTVYGPIASLSATTRGEIYEDNMSRCFIVAVDESHEQTLRIIQYQNNKSAGIINRQKEQEIRVFLRHCMRLLKPYDVVNRFANQIELPREAHKIRRLNDLFQSYVRQITLLNQYQRQKDDQGRLLTAKEDLQTAIEIMFDSIILKVDELDGSLRDFYEKLKEYVLNKGKDYEFEQREIRQKFRISKSQMQRHFINLMELEYITKSNIGIRNTYRYKISYWDNMELVKDKIKGNLYKQLNKL
ncbi:toprim domain-containing protein [Aureibacter tunicatorum]|uniref:DNA primase/ABC-type dipeptide/oligopeptide/nickel transport system ATPase component n=3 Tax=Aureibacter tunicatorum TaxID=866807 RepID=A0AAE4BVG8_9BACT|nr:toprim domain-containing protein [Aureibacter tunicatorum]MDR6242095.1 DNA primase/ABC-type dipeptide/oligopeptide/nickel transport system ATPase component [Aureibacter tunicatorum]BDD05642.1 hypothetical protein AUTU_31250 [Aureibacter tunicatorum]